MSDCSVHPATPKLRLGGECQLEAEGRDGRESWWQNRCGGAGDGEDVVTSLVSKLALAVVTIL
jgi:hypothetical protein